MESIVPVLFAISTALLVPVIVVLLGLLAWSLLQVGGVVREAQLRRRGSAPRRRAFDAIVAETEAPSPAARAFFGGDGYPGLLGLFARQGRPLFASALHLDKLVGDLEVQATSRLAHLNLTTRLGPMLGLMGTLIPMGPALIAMSSGDVEKMAGDLVVAFSTTVLGLLIGGLSFALAQARRRWYAQDLCDIEYVYQCMHGREAAA